MYYWIGTSILLYLSSICFVLSMFRCDNIFVDLQIKASGLCIDAEFSL